MDQINNYGRSTSKIPRTSNGFAVRYPKDLLQDSIKGDPKAPVSSGNKYYESLLSQERALVYGSPRGGIPEGGALPIRAGHSDFTKPIDTSTSRSPSSSFSSKRPSEVINLVSSDEDDDVDDVTPKRPRCSTFEFTTSKPQLKQHQQRNASSRSSSSNSTTNRIAPQRLRHIEIPIRKPTISRPTPIKPITPLAVAQRQRFLLNLSELRGPKVTVINVIDESSPSVSFQFVNSSILGPGVSRAPSDVMTGCDCKQHYGQQLFGCSYTNCQCLQDSAENEDGRKVFPYSAAKRNAGCLRDFFLESRHHIYECNQKCNCRNDCKNRNVQFGRQIQLEIFKTSNRGWGLRCPVELRKGDFIDTYRGEIVTVEEAVRRGNKRSADEGNYFMNFDKFSEPEAVTKSEFLAEFPDKVDWHSKKVRNGDWEIYRKDGEEMWLNPEYIPYLYVCDGMYVGGPTRFMNHSCDPNCRLFTVSYNHSDDHLYDLAFFALEAIPAGTELTFDYKDEDDRSIITHEQALEVQKRDGYMPQKCLCGTAECRQYFFN